MGATFAWLERTRSPAFNLGFAAGFETVAFSAARWVDKNVANVLGVNRSKARAPRSDRSRSTAPGRQFRR